MLKEISYQAECLNFQQMNSISQHVTGDQLLNFLMSEILGKMCINNKALDVKDSLPNFNCLFKSIKQSDAAMKDGGKS